MTIPTTIRDEATATRALHVLGNAELTVDEADVLIGRIERYYAWRRANEASDQLASDAEVEAERHGRTPYHDPEPGLADEFARERELANANGYDIHPGDSVCLSLADNP